jgi:hypothetical protein
MKRWIAVALLAAVAPAADFRFSRAVDAPAGWSALELPDDVLDACRPSLPDLRLRDARGEDVPYALAQNDGQAPRREELRDVEAVRKSETTALLDRGPAPPLARAVAVEISGEDFLKPVSIESPFASSRADLSLPRRAPARRRFISLQTIGATGASTSTTATPTRLP